MKQVFIACTLLLSVISGTRAQTRVFKEVGNEISSSMRAITQDDALVGYLVFTELERASKDSFNYKLTIMDENLNDIGVVNFREIKLDLKTVSFEQDVLCLGYLKSNLLGYTYNHRRDKKEAIRNGYLAVYTQFIDLTGKMLKTNTIKLTTNLGATFNNSANYISSIGLTEPLRINNVSGKGFACFFGDDRGKFLYVYDKNGDQTWQKRVGLEDARYNMLVSGHDVYFLIHHNTPGSVSGYAIQGYGLDDSTTISRVNLKDKKGNPFRVYTFDKNPATGKPFVSGAIINPRRDRGIVTLNSISKGRYLGVFTINVDGRGRDSIKALYNYWNDKKAGLTNTTGRFVHNKSYLLAGPAFKDFAGNTYFAGSAANRSLAVGLVIAEVATIPLIIPPLYLLGGSGTHKGYFGDAMVIKQTPEGVLSVDNNIAVKRSRLWPARIVTEDMDNKSYYSIHSPEKKATYLVITEAKNITLYHVDGKKVLRTIPRKDGNIETMIFPAKEGHMLVAEYDKKEKTRKFSIEAL
ncbi:DUF6770 family protein [Chitinophaga qingshengii]|uniref:Uncharacterized protein n=1 Tax=Chitinophaga qingshengii TaxID=1569794 RepID=A0ABR7TQS6_9BACT|nr:DUF6770 family protein [Chitinophaga qingshengii]MBC9931769.1 hypothetical protein [Chitinophaga qingshengii]